MNAIEQLKSVLCDPTGKCCIKGSEEDRAIVDRALQALAQPEQKPMHPEMRKMWEDHFDKCFRAQPEPPPECKTEALRLALEWLETHKPKISEGSLFVLTHAQVYIAVKTALANEALERKAENARELGLNYYVPCCADKSCPKCKATTPPQRTWVGLTDDEISQFDVDPIEAKLLIAKLKEKNNG
jgi:hypothetical protein